MNIDYWRQCADEGSTAGLIAMGDRYLRGDGVEQNFVEALHLLSLAHEKGALTGSFLLGTIYENVLGIKQDVTYAIVLYKQAAQINHFGALLHLARIYRSGKGSQFDSHSAAKWYRRLLSESDNMVDRALDVWTDEIKEARDFVGAII